MLINNSLDEIQKRETALKTIEKIITEKGRNYLFDLTGLSGGFIASKNELSLLETYVGPAIFENELQKYGKIHIGGEKILPVNRTSSGILASVLSLVKENSYLIHFLPKFPSHPSIIRSCKLVNAKYREFDDIDKFEIFENTSLIIITGSTMDHDVIDEDIFLKIINLSKKKNIPVLVDDASGARIRTTIFNQKRAWDLGADLVITSTDKLMEGPRGGILAGKKDLIDKIKVKANEFGLEAQPPSILAMVNALKKYNGENLIKSIDKKDEFLKILRNDFSMFKSSPTGVMILPEDLKKELKKHTNVNLSNDDLAFLFSMILLKNEAIITIPAVSMPGASRTIRFDFATKDAIDIDLKILYYKIQSSFKKLIEIANDEKKCRQLLFIF